MAKSVFYSFHYDQDVHRVQLIRNIGALEAQPVLNAQDWEEVEQGGDPAIEEWIHDQMAYTKAVIVLIGRYTSERPWVQYEIEKAWADRRPLLGVRIHGISSFGSVDTPGKDPFVAVGLTSVPIFDPTVKDWTGKINTQDTYAAVQRNLESWSSQGVVKP